MALLNLHSTLLNIHSTLLERAILSSKRSFVSWEGRDNRACFTLLVMSPVSELVLPGFENWLGRHPAVDLWKAAELSESPLSEAQRRGCSGIRVVHSRRIWWGRACEAFKLLLGTTQTSKCRACIFRYKHTSVVRSLGSTKARPACHPAVWNTWARGMKSRHWLWPSVI